MNRKIKWHAPTGPAFAAGEQWVAADKSGSTCEIIRVKQFGAGKWDHEVYYRPSSDPAREFSKDAWHFQVRYIHIADLNA